MLTLNSIFHKYYNLFDPLDLNFHLSFVKIGLFIICVVLLKFGPKVYKTCFMTYGAHSGRGCGGWGDVKRGYEQYHRFIFKCFFYLICWSQLVYNQCNHNDGHYTVNTLEQQLNTEAIGNPRSCVHVNGKGGGIKLM